MYLLAFVIAASAPGAAAAQNGAAPDRQTAAAAPPVTLSASQLFAFADAARDRRDYATATAAYRALSGNPDVELRTEARFRLGMMLADLQHKYSEAAIEFRRILDEKPGAARVRLELARMDALMGHLGAAEREFRAAQASGLPPEVEQLVRFYANALNARKPFGGSFEVAIAPDSNINRATKSDTLGTIIGDFTLDQNAKAQSGVGLSLRGQAYARKGIDAHSQLLLRLLGSADLYRQSAFDDFSIGVQLGPEYASGKDKLAVSVGPGWRWYSTDPYSFSIGGSASWQHPLSKRAQLRVEGGITHINNKRNDLQDADDFYLSAGIDRAFSARFGGGVQLTGSREAAQDPGYSTASGGVNSYLFRELGRTTAVLSLGYSHLEADQRLFLYPNRRVENRYSASLSATFRSLSLGSVAPLVKLRYERNSSTIEIYDYNRVAAEFGVTSAF